MIKLFNAALSYIYLLYNYRLYRIAYNFMCEKIDICTFLPSIVFYLLIVIMYDSFYMEEFCFQMSSSHFCVLIILYTYII